ncbi:MAG: alternative ribosome rescue aminoacyl-tRNA hydrolase ArfB [Thermodesulfobacteriota bacterium]
MLFITDTLKIPLREIHFSFIRASGPGGQHVNRSATAVQLRFDVQNSPSLSAEMKNRLGRLAGSRLSKDGILTIEAQEFRSQMRNRDEALQRLASLLRLAAMKPKARRPTRPTTAAKKRRLEAKKRRSLTKQTRGTHKTDE